MQYILQPRIIYNLLFVNILLMFLMILAGCFFATPDMSLELASILNVAAFSFMKHNVENSKLAKQNNSGMAMWDKTILLFNEIVDRCKETTHMNHTKSTLAEA